MEYEWMNERLGMVGRMNEKDGREVVGLGRGEGVRVDYVKG